MVYDMMAMASFSDEDSGMAERTPEMIYVFEDPAPHDHPIQNLLQ
jgi:hypothetical protein